jgi:hypothetical protein
MLRRCVIVACVLVLGHVGASKAEQLSSPDVTYVDGLPCNSLCLSYLAWSRRVLPSDDASSRSEARAPVPLIRTDTAIREERSKPAARAGAAKTRQVAAPSRPVRQAKVVSLQPAGKAAVMHGRLVKSAARPPNDAPPASRDGSQSAGKGPAAAAPAAVPPAPESKDMPLAKVADLPPTGSAAAEPAKPAAGIADPHPNAKAIQEQVTAATAVASRMTAATAVPTPEQQAGRTNGSDQQDNGLVALVMVQPGIKSVTDLSGKTIAVDDPQSTAGRQARAAIVAAGATGVQLTDGATRAIDQLISGAVPAAVLALVSGPAAEGFPEIAGFKVLQVPLSPSALKAGAETP